MKNHTFTICLFLSAITVLSAQSPSHDHTHGRKIVFPDIPGYRTLKCDFHIHTVFSDGNVWPTIRVEEALKDGLDAIAITEHLEYQPHEEDIPHPDRNRSYLLAEQFARAFELIIISGAEITRSMPPGHSNAIFVEDANKINVEDPVEAFREANRQGAFVFWNHPNWIAQRSGGIAALEDMHRQLIEEGLLHGIEVVNDLTYSDEALQIALDNGLTVIGTSDIHGLVDWQFKIPEGGHRPISLVFAAERSAESIREALQARRTVAWFNNILVGEAPHLEALINASLKVKEAAYIGTSQVMEVKIENVADASFMLRNLTDYTFHDAGDVITVPAHQTITLPVKTLEDLEQLELRFEVLNALSAPKKHPELVLEVKIN